jgi:hypothetical protein
VLPNCNRIETVQPWPPYTPLGPIGPRPSHPPFRSTHFIAYQYPPAASRKSRPSQNLRTTDTNAAATLNPMQSIATERDFMPHKTNRTKKGLSGLAPGKSFIVRNPPTIRLIATQDLRTAKARNNAAAAWFTSDIYPTPFRGAQTAARSALVTEEACKTASCLPG